MTDATPTIDAKPVPTEAKDKPAAWTPKEQNGQKEYRTGTTGAKVWAIAAKHTKDGLVDAAAVHAECTKAGIVKGSVDAALVTYRRYHAVKSAPKVKPEPKAETKPKADAKVDPA